MERKNSYREIEGGSVKGVAVCPYDCKGSLAYPRKTESLITCRTCRRTYMVDPVEMKNWMPWDEYNAKVQEQMEKERLEKEAKAEEKNEYNESLQSTRWRELELRNVKINIKAEEVNARKGQKEEAVKLLKEGLTVKEISGRTGLSAATVFRIKSGHSRL